MKANKEWMIRGNLKHVFLCLYPIYILQLLKSLYSDRLY